MMESRSGKAYSAIALSLSQLHGFAVADRVASLLSPEEYYCLR